MHDYHILIADQDPEELDRLETFLAGTGLMVSRAMSASTVISLFDAETVDLLLIDMALQGSAVEDLLKTIRKKTLQRPLQVLFMSPLRQELDRAVELGADDVVGKPVDKDELFMRLKAAVVRLREQKKMLQEKEFFRQAVKQEEAFSSRVLEQHLNLKKAFKDIERMNEDLERSNQKLERVAKYDMLSGLLNRLSLFTLMDVEIDRAARTETPLTGVMFDIDHFKEINDTYGHQLGDEAIRCIGRCLLGVMRKYDNAGRYGGEEFFIVLPNTKNDQGVMIAERFRKELEALPVECMDTVVRITASFGVAEYRPGESRDEWINRTDKAMYRAKQEGRNRVCE